MQAWICLSSRSVGRRRNLAHSARPPPTDTMKITATASEVAKLIARELERAEGLDAAAAAAAASACEAQGVDAREVSVGLSHADLKMIGIANWGLRRKLLRVLETLLQQQAAHPSPPAPPAEALAAAPVLWALTSVATGKLVRLAPNGEVDARGEADAHGDAGRGTADGARALWLPTTRADGTLTLRSAAEPRRHLRIDRGQADARGNGGPHCPMVVERHANGTISLAKAAAVREGRKPPRVGFKADGSLKPAHATGTGPNGRFRLQVVAQPHARDGAAAAADDPVTEAVATWAIVDGCD